MKSSLSAARPQYGAKSRGAADGASGQSPWQGSKGFNPVKLIRKDPGDGQPIFSGGAASMFVVAKPLMETRAKKAGVIDFWIGREPSEFPCNAPQISYKLDVSWARARVKVGTREASELRTACDLDGRYVFETSDGYLTTEDPIYYPHTPTEDDPTIEFETTTRIRYAPICVKTGDVAKFIDHTNSTSAAMLRWRTENSKHRARVVLATGVMEGCLGASANAVVKHLLGEDKIAEAWQSLQDYYVPHDVDVIREIDTHLRELKVLNPQLLPDYFNLVDMLREALLTCGADMSDGELESIVKSACLYTVEGRKAFEHIFKTGRQQRWDWPHLSMILLEEAHSLQQEAGIDYLEKEKIDREVAKRMKGMQLSANRANLEQGNVAGAGAVTQEQPVGPIVKGTDGKVKDKTKCFRCQKFGHIALLCPTRVPPTAATGEGGKGKGGAETAGANTAGGSGSKQTSPAPTPDSSGWQEVGKQGKVVGPKANRAEAEGAFVVEVDDNFEMGDEDVFATDTEVLELFLPTGGKGEQGDEL
jgi:hypothetical protein